MLIHCLSLYIKSSDTFGIVSAVHDAGGGGGNRFFITDNYLINMYQILHINKILQWENYGKAKCSCDLNIEKTKQHPFKMKNKIEFVTMGDTSKSLTCKY